MEPGPPVQTGGEVLREDQGAVPAAQPHLTLRLLQAGGQEGDHQAAAGLEPFPKIAAALLREDHAHLVGG